MDAALHAHDTALELQRLDRVRKNIKNLRERIDDNGSKLSIARLAKLVTLSFSIIPSYRAIDGSC